MGQQQILLIILGVIVTGTAIALGLQIFQTGSINANQDAMVNDIIALASDAQKYYIRPVAMGGGGGSFDGYEVPVKLENNGNGSYNARATNREIIIEGESAIYPEVSVTLTLTLSEDGWEYEWEWESEGL